jgi:ergothioneine biosynthesis protein EgtB
MTSYATAPADAGGTPASTYDRVRALTERLSGPLSAEDQTVQSMPDVSPTKWHRAHTTWFFETFLLSASLAGYRPFDSAYGYLFNSYYEALGPRHTRAERGLLSRPGTDDIARYRRHVDQHMKDLLEHVDPDGEVWQLVDLGLHHEQQHQELLLMDIKHVLGSNPLEPIYTRAGRRSAVPPVPSGWLEQPGGIAEIGHVGPGFAFDNEAPRHGVLLHPYAVASVPVTCGEWLAFIDDAGYRRAELWLSDGWAAVQQQGWHAPLYWNTGDAGWRVFTLHGAKPIDLNEPVGHVSYYEADAFARWAGCRLPTEAEWEHATAVCGWSARERFDEHDLQPRPADPAAGGIGEVWEWTASAYLPYPGFRPAAGAVGEYNGKFMVNQQVLRGGACITPPGHLRTTYRNFFPPSARWPLTGLRLAKDL